MFCKKCGTEMKEDARFCPKCGYDRLEGKEESKNDAISDTEVKYQVKPTFKVLYKFITTFGRAILYLFIIAICILDDFDEIDNFSTEVNVFIKPVIGIILIYIIIKMIFEKVQYNHYEYNFYNTKVEYKDGFLNREEKELKYKYIREVTMSQNILERIFNIGKIKIFTNASSGGYSDGSSRNSMRNKNGIYIHCVENVREQYEKVKAIIDQGTEEEK